jgi:hypothetical protein
MLSAYCSLCESPLTVTWIDLLFVVVSRFLPCRCNFSHPYVYHLDLGYKFSHVHPRVSADVIKPFVQPSACALRKGEVDFPVIRDASRPIDCLVARAAARGRPPRQGRLSFNTSADTGRSL